MKKFFILFFSVFIWGFSLPGISNFQKEIYAQQPYNTCSCIWVVTDCIPGGGTNCAPGNTAPCNTNTCRSRSSSQSYCEQPQTCTPASQPLPPSRLNLRSLYSIIQPGGGMFSMNDPLGSIISALLIIIFPIAGLILLLYLIWGGYNLMLSSGDPKKAANARGVITTAIIGMIIIFVAFWLTGFIGRILGLPDIYNMFG